MLRVEELRAGYRGLEILQGLSFDVREGELLALIGANGAGKTTTLRAISGLLRARAGTVTFGGRSIVGMRPHEIVRMGIGHVPENRELFGNLTVRENLLMGGFTRPAADRAERLGEVFELFPVLEERAEQRADTMSGGQQQMLCIGRAVMARPRLLLLDEPSLGLAPKLVTTMFELIATIRERGTTVVIVEQNAKTALKLADRACVLENGVVVLSGTGAELLDDPRVRSAYLGA